MDVEETQWTAAARQLYEQRAEELVEAIRTHVAAVLRREGRQAEMGPYFASAATVREAVDAFSDAEFDWCGSSPLPIFDDDEDEDEDDEDEDEDVSDSGLVLTAAGRWDLRVLDADAVIEAGRQAYARLWPEDTVEDAAIAVPDVVRAAGEIVHADGWVALLDSPGLERGRDATWFVQHEGSSDEEWESEPFRRR